MAHQYDTLPYDDSVRLLKLFPANNDVNDQPLGCALEDCRLSDDLSYEALSYTWGQPVFPELLHTHKGILNITENLALALRSLRFKDRVRYLWVDAVCINQNDSTEKSQQVAMMSIIYKSARRVICWLGQADEGIGNAMETLKRLAASASSFGITELFHGEKRTTTFSGHTKVQEDAFKEFAQTINFSTLAKFYSNSYFTRLWIIQEIALSQKAVLTVKPWSITYDQFAMGTAVLNNFLQTYAFETGKINVRNSWDVISIKLAYTRKQSRDILTDAELEAVNDDLWRPDWMSLVLFDMVDSITSECLDPRDKIYGLLSLNKDDLNDIDLTADYSKSASEVYTDFAKAYLVRKNIRILNRAGLQRKTQNSIQNSPLLAYMSTIPLRDTIPSWAPDWREPRPYMALGGFNRPGFTAGFSLSTHIETVPSNPTKVLISGLQIDTVTHISRPVNVDAAHTSLTPRYETHEPARASIVALQAFCESYYQDAGTRKYATGEDILTAFVRTVLADGVYSAFGDLFPVMKASPERMVIFWRIFALLKIKPDDAINLAPNTNLPNMQTGDPGKSRAQNVRTAWLIVTFMLTALSNHAVFMTSQGYLGLGPALAEVGDSVVVFGGSQTPFVMRKVVLTGVTKDFCILGECYLHGFMYRELLTEVHQAAVELFSIV